MELNCKICNIPTIEVNSNHGHRTKLNSYPYSDFNLHRKKYSIELYFSNTILANSPNNLLSKGHQYYSFDSDIQIKMHLTDLYWILFNVLIAFGKPF